ncbi:14794_t:CDS:2 [Dentiscutata erythropus]|uniref:14794_t:CDS:1 n=1 Tax=Dentiscutata erythropus TaxID=1348616 RepID=A0A9N9G5Q2_9GLOM|nr:14794_t:CDS:2 [Dentiscutata erythropus]
MKFLLFFLVLIEGVILISGKKDYYSKKGSHIYKRPNGSVSDPYPTVFKEKYVGGLRFLVLGDWGQRGNGTGQPQVAAAMKTWADRNKTSFVINVGDNFYQTSTTTAKTVTDPIDHEGVSNETDHKWKSYWLDVYGGRLKDIKWFTVAGNHDWYNNVTAEVDYFWDVDSRFFFPSLYYVRKVKFGEGICAAFIHIDTNPYYYNYTSYNHTNNLKQTLNDSNLYTPEQLDGRLKWLEDQLKNVQDTDWIFVVGHHPLIGDCRIKNDAYYLMYEIPPILTKYNVSAYFNGHAHDLSLSTDNATSPVTYFGSGAGGAALGIGCLNPNWTSPYTFGFLSVKIPSNGKTLYFDFVDANQTDTPPKVIYSGKIKSRKVKDEN